MAVFKSLTFDGINSLDYGIYITGEAVYNAPERAVEMVTIPGRNGALAIDQGYFENIEVSYPCGCFADTQADFAEKVSAFRNAIGSRYSYKRLTDEYNADEYRLGLYKSGLEVSAVRYGTAGQFTITFDCKPQRFLLDGDAELSPTDYSDVHTVSGDIVQIDNDGVLGVKSVLTTIEPIQSGSGTPSPDNVRPISGHTECVTSVCGVNVWDEEWEVGTINTSTGIEQPNANNFRTKNPVPVLASTAYFISNGSHTMFLLQYSADDSYHGYTRVSNQVITMRSDTAYIKFVVADTNTYTNDISINYPSTDHEYHAYDGNTYTTTLGRTVYGGTLDVVSGELVVDRAMVDLGSLNWRGIGLGAEYARFVSSDISSTVKTPPNNATPTTAICEQYSAIGASNLPSNNGTFGVYTDGDIGIKDESYADVASFKTAMNGVQLCYELSTPQTYQLSEQTIELLLGQNNLWASTGSVTVKYGVYPYYNPTEFDARPLIKITGSGNVAIGSQLISVTDIPNTTTVYIDCDTMEIYTLSGGIPSGASSHVSFNGNDFPVLPSGLSKVTYTTRGVSIAPRWWRI